MRFINIKADLLSKLFIIKFFNPKFNLRENFIKVIKYLPIRKPKDGKTYRLKVAIFLLIFTLYLFKFVGNSIYLNDE